MTNDGYTTAPRRGLFGRLRNRTTYSGPGYNTPYPGYGPVYSSPTTAAPMPMPSATTPSTAPSSQPVGDPATLTAPRTVPGTITSRSFYPPGTTISSNGTITLPPGATVVNGQIIPASGTIVTADGTIVPANYSMQSDYYNGSSQPTRRGLFGRLRNRY